MCDYNFSNGGTPGGVFIANVEYLIRCIAELIWAKVMQQQKGLLNSYALVLFYSNETA